MPVLTAAPPGATPPAPSAPASPVPYAQGPVISYGNGSTTTAFPPGSAFPQIPLNPRQPMPSLPAQQPAGSKNVSFLGSLGGIVGGVAGFLTGGVGGAVGGFKTGEQLFGGGGGGSPNLPALPGSTGGIAGGWNSPTQTLAGMFPGIGLATTPQPGVHGHYTKGTKRNPSHWSNRRRPRMNPMNVRAGRRAITRIHAAEKLFHRFLAVSHPGHAGRVKPKRIARR